MLENKSKIKNLKLKIPIPNLKILILNCSFVFCLLNFTLTCFAQEQFTYNAKGKRDPFIPLVTADGRLLKLDQEEEF